MRRAFAIIAGAVCGAALATIGAAQDLPSEGTVFTYDVTEKEGDTVARSFQSEITILDVVKNVVFFTECDFDLEACAIGQTDGVSVGFFDFYDLGDQMSTRLLDEFKRYAGEDFPYPPGQYLPFEDGKVINWTRGGGSAVGQFTQSCCVEGPEGQSLWQMAFVETFNGGAPTSHTRHVDPALGWHVYERIEVEFATMPAATVEYTLREVSVPE